MAATFCFAAGTLAGGLSAAGHLIDSAKLGTATTGTVVLDVAQIVSSVASFGASSLIIKSGSVAAAMASGRYVVPLLGTAAGADVVQLAAFGQVAWQDLEAVRRSGGSPEDQQRAMAVLLTQLVVMGGLTVLSVRGAREARAMAGRRLELVEAERGLELRVDEGAEATPHAAGAQETAPPPVERAAAGDAVAHEAGQAAGRQASSGEPAAAAEATRSAEGAKVHASAQPTSSATLGPGQDTVDLYVTGPVPKAGPARWKYIENPAVWTTERRALHDQLLAEAKQQAQVFADAMQGEVPTIHAMRGNTAAGKTRAIKANVPELARAVEKTANMPHRAVNPDTSSRR